MSSNKKVINFRPMLFIALALMAGITLCLFVLFKPKFFWWIFSIASAISLILLCLKKYKFAIILLAFVVGFGSHYLQFKTSVKEINEDEGYFIDARVVELSSHKSYCYITLDNIFIDGFATKGKAAMKIEGECQYEVNDRVELFGYIKSVADSSIIWKNLGAYGDKKYYEIDLIVERNVEQSSLDFFQRIKERMTKPMEGRLTKNNKAIAYSLLFGDTSHLSQMDKFAIRDSGLSHIFAVSGLHISFIVALIAFLFKKLKLNRWLSMLLTATVLFIYCGITGFPSSALRASLMAMIFLFSVAVYKKIDSLSALATAAIIILIISPLTLFSLSFIMSVSAVLGIILFYKPINNFLMGRSKKKFRKFVSASIALSLSATIFLLPIFINIFGTISIYLIIANLLILPLVTIIYIYLLVSAFLCILTPWFGFMYLFGNIVIEGIRFIATNIASLPYAVLQPSRLGIFTLAYILIMMLISRFILLSKYKKLVGVVVIFIVGVFLVLIM